MNRIQEYISHLQQVLNRLSVTDIRSSIDLIMAAYHNEQQVFVVGNGAAPRQHRISAVTLVKEPLLCPVEEPCLA